MNKNDDFAATFLLAQMLNNPTAQRGPCGHFIIDMDCPTCRAHVLGDDITIDSPTEPDRS